MAALDDLIQTIASGAKCEQEAGCGPFVFAPARTFAARTARHGERLGLLELVWCAPHWRWVLTEAGHKRAANT